MEKKDIVFGMLIGFSALNLAKTELEKRHEKSEIFSEEYVAKQAYVNNDTIKDIILTNHDGREIIMYGMNDGKFRNYQSMVESYKKSEEELRKKSELELLQRMDSTFQKGLEATDFTFRLLKNNEK